MSRRVNTGMRTLFHLQICNLLVAIESPHLSMASLTILQGRQRWSMVLICHSSWHTSTDSPNLHINGRDVNMGSLTARLPRAWHTLELHFYPRRTIQLL